MVMAQLNNVNPGDPITAANWNALVAAVQALSGAVSTGGVTVPNLFGLTLGNAVAIINLPATQLSVGAIIDTTGAGIDSNAADAKSLIVLNQMPQAGSGVVAHTSVNLVVTAKSGGSVTPQLPVITPFSNAVATAILSPVQINGQNFDPTPANNTVTFSGINGTVGGNSTKNQLFVTVPAGIPGAPTSPGQTLSVPVVVRTSAGPSAAQNLLIGPPAATPPPTITLISPASQVVGGDITITGTGFDGTTLTNNSVVFLNQTVAAKTATSTQITVTIPTGINGLNKAGDSVSIGIVVQVSGRISLASPPYSITRLT
jgi:hypothetical protein